MNDTKHYCFLCGDMMRLHMAQRCNWHRCDMHSGIIGTAVTCIGESLTPLWYVKRCNWHRCANDTAVTLDLILERLEIKMTLCNNTGRDMYCRARKEWRHQWCSTCTVYDTCHQKLIDLLANSLFCGTDVKGKLLDPLIRLKSPTRGILFGLLPLHQSWHLNQSWK
jgi:hypothetical protein